jgi:hypothetical protein
LFKIGLCDGLGGERSKKCMQNFDGRNRLGKVSERDGMMRVRCEV